LLQIQSFEFCVILCFLGFESYKVFVGTLPFFLLDNTVSPAGYS
jgi:hypothetical protein